MHIPSPMEQAYDRLKALVDADGMQHETRVDRYRMMSLEPAVPNINDEAQYRMRVRAVTTEDK